MTFLVSWLVAVWICSSSAQPRQTAEGDACTLKDGREGICRVISACPSVLATIKQQRPVLCVFKKNSPVVCCGDDAAASLVPDRKPIYMDPALAVKKVEAKCKDYSRIVTYFSGALPLLPKPVPTIIETPKCDAELPLVVGGKKTRPGEFPHMAALGYKQDGSIAWLCGGTLISDRWVLTAAHCIATKVGPPVIARLGEFDLTREDDGAHPEDFSINLTMKHPEYKAVAKYNDIGLLRLNQPVRFSDFIRPACLYPNETIYVNKSLATGWGQIGVGLEQSEILLKVWLDLITNEMCDQLYHSSKGTVSLSEGIVPTMLCAGVLKGGKDTCHGDSGGPLQIISQSNKCIYYVIGITSFGKFCAVANSPGVYTRVSQYLPWIVSVVWP